MSNRFVDPSSSEEDKHDDNKEETSADFMARKNKTATVAIAAAAVDRTDTSSDPDDKNNDDIPTSGGSTTTQQHKRLKTNKLLSKTTVTSTTELQQSVHQNSSEATTPVAATIPIRYDKRALDESEIRFATLDPQWKHDIPKRLPAFEFEDPEHDGGRYQHEIIAIVGDDSSGSSSSSFLVNDNNEYTNKQNDQLLVLGGIQLADGEETWAQSVQALDLGWLQKCHHHDDTRKPPQQETQQPNCQYRPTEWCLSTYPDMNETRTSFGAVHVGRKLYAIGGGTNSFEILDLDNIKSGWTLVQENIPKGDLFCRAVVVDNRYIYCLSATGERNMFFEMYDTITCTWEKNLEPCKVMRDGFTMTLIVDPASSATSVTGVTSEDDDNNKNNNIAHKKETGTYLVVLGGVNTSCELEPTVEAYHVETKRWIQLPNLPDDYGLWNSSTATNLGNRYVLVAGGGGTDLSSCASSAVMALDWKTKEWLELPTLPASQSGGAGVYVGGSTQKWIITGGWGDYTEGPSDSSSLDISMGIGWAKEKLLLLCFRGKATSTTIKKSQQENKDSIDGRQCLLEGLDSGIFANILLYLFRPFPFEIQCKGSIFRSMLDKSSSSSKCPNE